MGKYKLNSWTTAISLKPKFCLKKHKLSSGHPQKSKIPLATMCEIPNFTHRIKKTSMAQNRHTTSIENKIKDRISKHLSENY